MEIKAVITEITSSNKVETTKKEVYKTEEDILRFKKSIKEEILHRHSIFDYIRRTDYYFVYQINGLWQMNDKSSVMNNNYKQPTRDNSSKGNSKKVDSTTIEVNGVLRSLKITAAVSRGWYKFIDTMPITPSEVRIVKSILSMPSGIMSPKQYDVLQEVKAKVNRRQPI